jgi:hypothetical protein
MKRRTEAELLAWIEEHQSVTREKLPGAFEDMHYEQLQGWQRLGPEKVLAATHILSATFERFITKKTWLILLISFAFICTVKATDIDDLIIKGLPVKVLSSDKSYKVFEQYPWEGHSSNYGPKGNRLNSSYGVGVGKNIFRSLQLRHGDWIHMPNIGWRQINESSSKKDSVEFFATYRDEYKSKYPRITIDMVAFALPSNQEPSLAAEF